MMSDLKLEGVVLFGDDDELFLAYGAHRPLDYATGAREIPPASIGNFASNLERRAKYAARRRTPYVHLVAPDKHAVLRDCFPVKGFASPAERVRAETGANFLYPVAELRALHRSTPAYHRTDTHWTIASGCVAAAMVARALGLPEAEVARGEATLAGNLRPASSRMSGDLGSKLDPPQSNEEQALRVTWPTKSYSRYVSQNKGKMIFTASLFPHIRTRLLIFGDSFLFLTLPAYTAFFSEVLICRTQFFHAEIMAAFAPTHLLTQNVERYMVDTQSDLDAPPFLMLPSDPAAVRPYPKGHYEALAAILSPRRERFLMKLRMEMEGQAGTAAVPR